MEQQQLRELLERLQRELGQVGELDAEARAWLASLKEEIQVLLDRSDSGPLTPESYHPLRERLGDSIRHFEVVHPRLTSTAENVINTLAGMGI